MQHREEEIIDNLVSQTEKNERIYKSLSFYSFLIVLLLILWKFMLFIDMSLNNDSILIPKYAYLYALFDSMILGSFLVIGSIISFISFYSEYFKFALIINLFLIFLNFIFPYIYSVT